MAQYSRKLSSGVKWYFKFSLDGQTYFSPCIYLTKGEAKKAEAEKYKEVDELRRNPHLKNEIYLKDLINDRLDEIQTKKSAKYYEENKRYLAILLKALDNRPVSQITKGDINTVLLNSSKEKQEEGKANYSVNAMLRCFKALFYFGIDNNNLNISNPCKHITPFSIDKKLKYIPTDEEIDAVLKLCNFEQKFFINFLKETGARLSEALRFKGRDIFPDYIVLYTRKSKNSNLVPRKLPVPGCLKGKKFNKEQLVFDRWSELPKFLDKKLRKLRKGDSNVRLWGYHNLRHRYASWLSKEGVPLFEIMTLLGHSSITTTQIYLQLLS